MNPSTSTANLYTLTSFGAVPSANLAEWGLDRFGNPLYPIDLNGPVSPPNTPLPVEPEVIEEPCRADRIIPGYVPLPDDIDLKALITRSTVVLMKAESREMEEDSPAEPESEDFLPPISAIPRDAQREQQDLDAQEMTDIETYTKIVMSMHVPLENKNPMNIEPLIHRVPRSLPTSDARDDALRASSPPPPILSDEPIEVDDPLPPWIRQYLNSCVPPPPRTKRAYVRKNYEKARESKRQKKAPAWYIHAF
jgi:hypothetical protein